jgi:GNAT superfamily N-acetyltransferase
MAFIRRAVPSDAAEIAAVHVASWQETYAHLLPASYIEQRTHAVRQAFWTDCLREADPAICVFVACYDDRSICGFASGGPERAHPLGLPGELYSLYLLDAAQGFGIGRQLVSAVLAALAVPALSVWVLAGNPARGFYEHLGAVLRTERQVHFAGEPFIEVGYELPASPTALTLA